MKRFVLFFALIALFAVNKVSAAVGDVITGYVTCVEKDGTSRPVEMMFQVMSEDLKYIRIYGYKNDDRHFSSLSLFTRDDQYEGCEIIVPKKIDDYTVKAVGNYAFFNCKAKVTLPETVTDIEDSAFREYNYNGYDFTLPSKVIFIGEAAFMYSNIRGIALNANLKNIGNYAFQRCFYLEELIIPKSVYIIGELITLGCDSLERLEVESGCANYSSPSGSNVIMDTRNNSKVIIAGCKNSKIPSETTGISRSVFNGINFPNTTITIPENVGFIGSIAFEGSNIKHLVVRSDNVEIQERAFLLCTDLERIDFYGDNVNIGRSAFENCDKLESVYCWSHIPDICHPMARQFYYSNNENAIVYAKYPNECRNATYEGEYSTYKPWLSWFKEIRDISEGESTIIDEVHITDFDWPLGGEDADYTATSLTPHATVSNISYQMYLGGWKEIDPKPASLGETYSIGFTINLDDGYIFGEAPKLYIDNRKADLRITSSATDTQMKFVVDNYVVPAPPGGVPIKKAYLSVAEPVEGQPLSNTVTNPTGKKYDLLGYRIDTVFWGHAADASLDSYDPTKGYTLAAILTAKQDYCFGTDCVFTLNGKTASVIRSHTAEGRERVMLAVAFGNEEPVKPDTTYITTLNLTVAEPVEGEVPVAELVSPTAREMETMGYTIRHIYWQPEDTPYDKSQEFDFRVTLEVTDDYTFFTPDVQVTLNGHAATLYGNPLSYYTTNKDKRCIIDWVYTPNKRGDVNGDGSVNTADVVAVYSYIEKGDASGFDRKAADVNNDGSVNTADVVAIYSIIINGE